MRYPSFRVGNAALVASRVISTVACRLSSIVGYSNLAAPYILVFEAAAVPANGTTAAFTIAVTGSNYALALPNPVDMDACVAVASSTPDILTPVAGLNQSIVGMLAP